MSVDEGAPIDELAQQIAETVGRVLAERDRAARRLGVVLAAIRPDYVRLTMTVGDDMADARRGCHRGVIVTLAETAFEFAASATNQAFTALGGDVSHLAPARIGDRLTAEASRRGGAGRLLIYDVAVRNDGGEQVALYRARAHRRDGEVVSGITVAA